MADVSVFKNSFTGGEWAPSLWDRFDLAKHGTAVKTMKNFFCRAHGAAANRGGSMFVGDAKVPSAKARLIPFEFSVVQTYMLEFGNQYMRVYKDRSRVFEAAQTPTAITKANPGVVTIVGHGYSNGDWVEAQSIGGMTELNGRMFVVANKTNDTFELTDIDGNNVNTTSFTTFTSGGSFSKVYQLTTPWTTADLPLLKFEQSADVLFVWHPSYDERQISRTGHAAWTIGATTYGAGVSAPTSFARDSGSGTGHTYAVTAVTDEGYESLPSNTATGGPDDVFDWVAPSGNIDSYNFYEVINGIYMLLGTAVGLSFTVPSSSASTTETAPRTKTPFSGADNRPGVGAFFQQRMVRARTNNFPQSLFGSVVGDFNNHNIRSPIRDDDAFKFTINSRQVNEIRGLIALDELMVFTAGAEWKVSAGSNADAVGPLSVKIEKQSQYGSSNVPPLIIGGTILFVDFSGEVVRDLLYSLEVDKYAGNDLTILANHLLEGHSITEWSYQQKPDSIIWMIREDGKMLGLTYHKEHQVWGWHQHETNGKYESVASIPNGSGGIDTYIIVRRIINGTVRRFVEVMKERLPLNGKERPDVRDAFFVDSGLSLDEPLAIEAMTTAEPVVVTITGHGLANDDKVDLSDIVGMLNADDESELNGKQFMVKNKTNDTFELYKLDGTTPVDGAAFTDYVESGYARKAVTTISGLRHLIGEEIVLLSNGNVIKGKTVDANGEVTLMNAASRVHAGLGYTSDLALLDFIYDTKQGSVRDKSKWVSSLLVSLRNTRALYAGPSADRLNEVKFRDSEDYSAPIELYTGDKEISIDQSEDYRSTSVFFRNTDPVPVEILGVAARISHGEV